MINRDFGSKCGFTGGAEETPIVTVVKSNRVGHQGTKVLLIQQDHASLRISLETLDLIRKWATQ